MEPPTQAAGSYFVPARPTDHGAGTILLVPRYSVFGSEELSSLAPGIAARTAQPVLALSLSQSNSLGLHEGQTARLTTDQGVSIDLPVAIRTMPDGVASVPIGTAGVHPGAGAVRARLTGGAQ